MTLLTCCLYLLLILLVGYAVVSLIQPSTPLTVVCLTGLCPAIGAGTMGLLLFWASLLGFAPSRALLAVIAILAFAGLLTLQQKNRLAPIKMLASGWEKDDGWAVVPLAVTALGLAIIVTGAVSSPLLEWDAFAIWGLKAKVLAHEALRPTPAYFHDLTLSYSHQNYPLMLPFLTAGGYAALGTIDDHAGKLVSVFLDILLASMVYLGLRWKLRRLPAACLTAMLTLLPVMFRYGGVGCADLPLAMFYTGSAYYLARWISEKQRQDLILSILFSAFAAFTKREGAVLALFNGVVILGFEAKSNRRQAILGTVVFFGGLLAVDGPWWVWSRALPHTNDDYAASLFSADALTHLPALKKIIPAMITGATSLHDWGLVWILAAIMALLGWRAFGRPPVLALWGLLGLHLAVYAFVYCLTTWNLELLLSVTLNRLLLSCVPVVMLLIGWHWAEIGTGPAKTAGQAGARDII